MTKRITKYQKAVRKGARLLDRKKPGWWKKIKLETFDISNPRHCILGQIFLTSVKEVWQDGFDIGQTDLNLSSSQVKEYGFDAFCEDYDNMCSLEEAYSNLAEEWIYQIKLRKSINNK